MTKKISAAVVIWDGVNILLCHVTHAKHWDLPKGKMEPHETEQQAAIRELWEETGLQAQPQDLKYLGVHSYKPRKDLSMWLWKVDKLPDISLLTCQSHFLDPKGRSWPEMDAFRHVPLKDVGRYVVSNMAQVLKRLELDKYPHGKDIIPNHAVGSRAET